MRNYPCYPFLSGALHVNVDAIYTTFFQIIMTFEHIFIMNCRNILNAAVKAPFETDNQKKALKPHFIP